MPHHTIPYHVIPYHTIPYHTIPQPRPLPLPLVLPLLLPLPLPLTTAVTAMQLWQRRAISALVPAIFHLQSRDTFHLLPLPSPLPLTSSPLPLFLPPFCHSCSTASRRRSSYPPHLLSSPHFLSFMQHGITQEILMMVVREGCEVGYVERGPGLLLLLGGRRRPGCTATAHRRRSTSPRTASTSRPRRRWVMHSLAHGLGPATLPLWPPAGLPAPPASGTV